MSHVADSQKTAISSPFQGVLLPSGPQIITGKDRTGSDLDERPSIFSMSPNQAISSDKSIRFSPLAAARPLTIRSHRRGAQRQSLQACLPDGQTAQCLFSACSPRFPGIRPSS